MKRMIDQILRQYGVSAEVEHEGKVVRLRIFFQPSMSKSWDSMNPIVTPLGQLPGGQYLYIGPADQPIGQGDQVTVGGKSYIMRRTETYLDRNGPIYQWALCVRKGSEETWEVIV
jgi:hypothetical protein